MLIAALSAVVQEVATNPHLPAAAHTPDSWWPPHRFRSSSLHILYFSGSPNGRNSRTRTCGLLSPRQAFYQSKLYLEIWWAEQESNLRCIQRDGFTVRCNRHYAYRPISVALSVQAANRLSDLSIAKLGIIIAIHQIACGDPTEDRTPVQRMKISCPRPLDDGTIMLTSRFPVRQDCPFPVLSPFSHSDLRKFSTLKVDLALSRSPNQKSFPVFLRLPTYIMAEILCALRYCCIRNWH